MSICTSVGFGIVYLGELTGTLTTITTIYSVDWNRMYAKLAHTSEGVKDHVYVSEAE